MSFLATLITAQRNASTSRPANKFLVFVDNEKIQQDFITTEDVDNALIEIVKSKIPNVDVKVIDLQEGKVIVDEVLNPESNVTTEIKDFNTFLLESDFAIEVKSIPIPEEEDTLKRLRRAAVNVEIARAIEDVLEDLKCSEYRLEDNGESFQYAVKI